MAETETAAITEVVDTQTKEKLKQIIDADKDNLVHQKVYFADVQGDPNNTPTGNLVAVNKENTMHVLWMNYKDKGEQFFLLGATDSLGVEDPVKVEQYHEAVRFVKDNSEEGHLKYPIKLDPLLM